MPYDDSSFWDNPTVHSGTTVTHSNNSSISIASNGTQTANWHGAFSVVRDFIEGATYNVKYRITSNTFSSSTSFYLGRSGFSKAYSKTISAGETGIFNSSFTYNKSTHTGLVSGNQMNLLFTMDQNSGSIAFEDFQIIGLRSNEIIKKDWTNKVDMDSFDMKMMDLSEKVEFSCVKDKNDYSSNKLSNHVTTAGGKPYNYGDLNYVATDYTNLSGVEDVKNLLFASTIIKPIGESSSLSTFITPSIYKGEDDGNFTFYKSKPRILFDNGVKTTSSTFTSPTPSQNDGLTGFTNQNEYLLFTHFSDFDLLTGASATCQDYNWTDCFSFIDNYSVNNLFSEYWSTYYNELYHPDTRMYTVECLLNHNDISNFKFNNIIVIENSEFRVNNISYNSEGLSKVELIKLP